MSYNFSTLPLPDPNTWKIALLSPDELGILVNRGGQASALVWITSTPNGSTESTDIPARFQPDPSIRNGPDTLTVGGISPDGHYQIAINVVTQQIYRVKDGAIEAVPPVLAQQGGLYPTAINNNGDFVGYGLQVGNVVHAFASIGGVIQVITPPGSDDMAPVSLNGGASNLIDNMTRVTAINSHGVIAGAFTTDNGTVGHGFIDDHGVITIVDVPGSKNTSIYDLDDAGNITGTFDGGIFVAEKGGFPVLGTPLAHTFHVVDMTAHVTSDQAGEPYHGPVTGLTSELIMATNDNVNIDGMSPNVFIHSGSGFDAINVSAAGGNNIMDGGTGSNFLTGGAGQDDFFVDDRDATQTVWSTMTNFHAGDNATMWGITRDDFTITKADDQGAAGFTGATLVAHQAGRPDALVTFAGYNTADLSNGHLSMAFGHTDDLPGLPGSDYLTITAH